MQTFQQLFTSIIWKKKSGRLFRDIRTILFSIIVFRYRRPNSTQRSSADDVLLSFAVDVVVMLNSLCCIFKRINFIIYLSTLTVKIENGLIVAVNYLSMTKIVKIQFTHFPQTRLRLSLRFPWHHRKRSGREVQMLVLWRYRPASADILL